MKKDNLLYWIWLSEACGPKTQNIGYLCERFEDPFDVYRLDDDELSCLEDVHPIVRERLSDKSLASAYEILRYCRKQDVDIITYADPRYPSRLRMIEDPPVLLYCLGTFPDMNHRLCVGMVGTRRMSEYGKQTAYRIAYELASARAVVVSGMALGVDAVAASAVLEAGGSTVAVLGCGVATVYPKEHKRLMRAIVKHGAVVTEYPPTAKPDRQHFPRRNRIISGLCQGTLVIEGDMSSGALITAKHAIAQGREVFALPGNVDEPNSEGPNDLIRNGTHVALSSDDILCFYDFLYHDALDFGALTAAKRAAMSPDDVLRRYGVAWRGEKGQKQAKTSPKPDGKPQAKEQAVVPQEPAQAEAQEPIHPDKSEQLLASVDATTRRVFEQMPTDRAVTADQLAAQGIDIGDVITALTLLEIVGLVQTLPGSMYIRK